MSKKKMTPAQKAAARREVTPEQRELAQKREAERTEQRAAAARERRMGTKSEQLTRRIFTGVQVVLVLIPFALLGFNGIMGGGDIQTMMQGDPVFAVTFLMAMVQPFVAWIIHFSYKHHADGDDGYTLGNLIGLTCAELCLQNPLGIAGCLVLLWRVWRSADGALAEWKTRRGLGGMLVDISGALVVFVLAAICAFASWRVGIWN